MAKPKIGRATTKSPPVTQTTYVVALPYWFLAAAAGAFPAWYWVRFRQLRRRKKRGLCPQCGYDLTGNVSGVCSECGEKI